MENKSKFYAPNLNTDIIGKNKQKIDAAEKVTGEAIFADDIQFGPKLLHARISRSPYPHAKIISINTTKAKALPGVKVITSGMDFPGYIGLYLQDRHIFAKDTVRYIGDPVVGVAANTSEIADQAVELIEIEYEPLEPVFDPEFGVNSKAPLIHPNLSNYEVANFIYPIENSNISNHFKIRKGNISEGWKECTEIVERKYTIPHIQHVPIEPHVAIAQVDRNGNITLWSSSQSPFAQRNLIAKALNISQTKIRVIAPFVGGGFGCKAGVSMEALVVALALKAGGRPVKLVLTREEEFYTAFVRQGLIAYFKIGCDKNGKLIAMQNTFYWDGGAYTEYGVNITRASGYSSSGPYEVPNIQTDSYCVYTNHPVGGPMRGFGMPEMHAGLEQCIDELAYKVNISPVEFRRINCLRTDSILVTGSKMHPTGLIDCLVKTADAINFDEKYKPVSKNKRRGKGIALMWKAPAMPPNAGSSAWVEMAEDGKLVLGIGGQDLGQGSFTIAAQIAAETLGVPYDWIKVSTPIDTQTSPYEWQTVASRLTWSMGNAIINAASDAKNQLLNLAAKYWGEDIENLTIINGIIVSYKTERELPIKDLAIYGLPKTGDQGWIGGPIIGRGSFMPSYVTGLDPDTGQGEKAVVHYTTGAQAVEVEVDMLTGKVDVLRCAAAFDVGKAINPDLVRAQMEGGFVQGLSSALFESLNLHEGEVLNPSFVDYRIATATDIPETISTFIIEVPQDDGPWGARGIGEHAMVPTIPAIANAIYDAVGIRLEGPPFTSEKVYLAMQESGMV